MGWTNDTVTALGIKNASFSASRSGTDLETSIRVRDLSNPSSKSLFSLDLTNFAGLDFQAWDRVGDSTVHPFVIDEYTGETDINVNFYSTTFSHKPLAKQQRQFYIDSTLMFYIRPSFDTIFKVSESGQFRIGNYGFPIGAGSSGQSLQLDANNNLQWVTPTSTATAKYYEKALLHTTFNPADTTTYYFGNTPKAASSSATINKMYWRTTDTITAIELYCFANTTAGTGEGITFYIRKNNATSTQVAKIYSTSAERVVSNTAISIPMATGDYIEIVMQWPTQSTNSQGVVCGGNLRVKYW